MCLLFLKLCFPKCSDVRKTVLRKQPIHEKQQWCQAGSSKKTQLRKCLYFWLCYCGSDGGHIRFLLELEGQTYLASIEVGWCRLMFAAFVNAPFIKRSPTAQAIFRQNRLCDDFSFDLWPKFSCNDCVLSEAFRGVKSLSYRQLQQVVEQSFAFALDEGVGAAGFGYPDPGQPGFLDVGRRGQHIKQGGCEITDD